MTQNTVFQYVKNIFLLSQKKLIFFTELNLFVCEADLEVLVLYVRPLVNMLKIVTV